MFKKSVSIIFAVIVIFSCFAFASVSVSAADSTEKTLISLIKKFPHGKYWNHVGSKVNDVNSVTSEPCPCHASYSCDYFGGCSCNSYDNAIQCMGYAEMISSRITGTDVSKYDTLYSLDVTKLRVGDIIRSSGHSVCVTGVNGNKISITDCNYGEACIIRWRTVDKSWFSYIEYVQHLSSNNRTNKNVDFHDLYKNAEISGNMKSDEKREENWTAPSNKYITVRKSAKTSAEVVGKIPANKDFKVYAKTSDGKYLWGKVAYKNIKGYGVLNNAYYSDGRYQVPDFKELPYLHNVNEGVKLSWNAVSGAVNYRVFVRQEGNRYGGTAIETKKTSCTLKDLPEGIYEITVRAENPLSDSWSVTGGTATVKVSKITVNAEKLTLKKSAVMDVGKSGTLTPSFVPPNTTNKKVVWKSSNTKVATVDGNGLVKAIAPGKAVITCTSKANSKLKASCEITVRPLSVKLTQVKSGTTVNSVGLKWEKAKGASGYTVYSYNTKTKELKKITSTAKTAYTVKNLKTATEYVFVVKSYAKTASGNIESSYKQFNAVTAPGKVTGLKQVGSDTGRLKLQWTKQKNADFYVVYKYDVKKKKYIKLGTSDKNSYVVKSKPAMADKYCVIAAIEVSDGVISGKTSDVLKGITGLAVPALNLTSAKTSVKLSWSKVPHATRYTVYKLVSGKKVLIKTVASDVTSYTDKGLKANTKYTYYVRAERVHSKNLNVYSSYVSANIKTKK